MVPWVRELPEAGVGNCDMLGRAQQSKANLVPVGSTQR